MQEQENNRKMLKFPLYPLTLDTGQGRNQQTQEEQVKKTAKDKVWEMSNLCRNRKIIYECLSFPSVPSPLTPDRAEKNNKRTENT